MPAPRQLHRKRRLPIAQGELRLKTSGSPVGTRAIFRSTGRTSWSSTITARSGEWPAARSRTHISRYSGSVCNFTICRWPDMATRADARLLPPPRPAICNHSRSPGNLCRPLCGDRICFLFLMQRKNVFSNFEDIEVTNCNLITRRESSASQSFVRREVCPAFDH